MKNISAFRYMCLSLLVTAGLACSADSGQQLGAQSQGQAAITCAQIIFAGLADTMLNSSSCKDPVSGDVFERADRTLSDGTKKSYWFNTATGEVLTYDATRQRAGIIIPEEQVPADRWSQIKDTIAKAASGTVDVGDTVYKWLCNEEAIKATATHVLALKWENAPRWVDTTCNGAKIAHAIHGADYFSGWQELTTQVGSDGAWLDGQGNLIGMTTPIVGDVTGPDIEVQFPQLPAPKGASTLLLPGTLDDGTPVGYDVEAADSDKPCD